MLTQFLNVKVKFNKSETEATFLWVQNLFVLWDQESIASERNSWLSFWNQSGGLFGDAESI